MNVNSSVNIYPNPNAGAFIIDATFAQPLKVEIIITNILGQQVMKVPEENADITYRRQINLTETPGGIYFYYVVIAGEPIARGRLIICR